MGAIRLFLALMVAADHWRGQVLTPAGISPDDLYKLGFNAGYAVLFFYVISGFLITYTLEHNYEPTAKGIFAFYRNRFVRIFSLYWPMLLVSIYLTGLQHNPLDLFTNVFLFGADWSLPFTSYPAEHWTALPDLMHQGWSLGAELVFYVSAPLLLRDVRLALALLIGSLTIRFYFVYMNGPQIEDTWTYHFAPSTFCFFLFGHFAARLARLYPMLRASAFIPLLAVSVLVMASGNYANFDTPRLWVPLICFTVALPAVFECTKDIRFLNWLGDLSYPVYLVHIFAFTWIGNFVLSAFAVASWGPGMLAYLAATLILSFAVHVVVERPVAQTMQTAFARLSARMASTSFLIAPLYRGYRLVAAAVVAVMLGGGAYNYQSAMWVRGAVTTAETTQAQPKEPVPKGNGINLIWPSENFSDARWHPDNATVEASVAAPPGGTGKAERLVEGDGQGRHRIEATVSGLTAGAVHTLSVFVRPAQRSAIVLEARDNPMRNYGRISFDLIKKAVFFRTAEIIDAGIEPAADGWYRCWMSAAFTGERAVVDIGLVNGEGTHYYQGDGRSGIDLWGAQFDRGGGPGKYTQTIDGPAGNSQ